MDKMDIPKFLLTFFTKQFVVSILSLVIITYTGKTNRSLIKLIIYK